MTKQQAEDLMINWLYKVDPENCIHWHALRYSVQGTVQVFIFTDKPEESEDWHVASFIDDGTGPSPIADEAAFDALMALHQVPMQ